VARLLKASSSFGAELDSLSDVVCFGVAPALTLYIWTLQDLGALGWPVALLFTVCMALRLARFNTQLGVTDKPSYAYNFNTGVPAPAAAGLALLPLCASFELGPSVVHSPYLCALTTIGTSALMVSRLPTYAGKRIRIPADWVLPVMLAVGVLFTLLTTAPWPTLLVLGLAYLGSIPFSVRGYARLKKAAETLRAGAPRPDAPLLRAVETSAPPEREARP
jgi:CDP-diacylglycerol--serine O-phosphatidyltransferase